MRTLCEWLVRRQYINSTPWAVGLAAAPGLAKRRELAAPGAENLSPAELGGRLVVMQRSRARLERALATALAEIGLLLSLEPLSGGERRVLSSGGRRVVEIEKAPGIVHFRNILRGYSYEIRTE